MNPSVIWVDLGQKSLNRWNTHTVLDLGWFWDIVVSGELKFSSVKSNLNERLRIIGRELESENPSLLSKRTYNHLSHLLDTYQKKWDDFNSRVLPSELSVERFVITFIFNVTFHSIIKSYNAAIGWRTKSVETTILGHAQARLAYNCARIIENECLEMEDPYDPL